MSLRYITMSYVVLDLIREEVDKNRWRQWSSPLWSLFSLLSNAHTLVSSYPLYPLFFVSFLPIVPLKYGVSTPPWNFPLVGSNPHSSLGIYPPPPPPPQFPFTTCSLNLYVALLLALVVLVNSGNRQYFSCTPHISTKPSCTLTQTRIFLCTSS